MTYVEQIKKKLREEKLIFEASDEDGITVFSCPMKTKCLRNTLVLMLVHPKMEMNEYFCRIIPHVPQKDRAEMLRILNEVNRSVSICSLYMRDDGAVLNKYACFWKDTEETGANFAFEMLMIFAKLSDEIGKRIQELKRESDDSRFGTMTFRTNIFAEDED